MLHRIYTLLGAPTFTRDQKTLVKDADFRAALAEGALGCGGRGFADTQHGFYRDRQAEQILLEYLKTFQVHDAIAADGPWARLYERRLRCALRRLQTSVSYAAAEVA